MPNLPVRSNNTSRLHHKTHQYKAVEVLAWYKVRVLDSNSNVHVAFKDGRTHRLYPARLKLMWHR